MSQSIENLENLTAPQYHLLSRVEKDKAFTDIFFFTGGTLLKALGIVPRHSNDLDFFTFPTIENHDFLKAQSHTQELLVNTFGSQAITLTDKGFLHNESGMLIDLIADGSRNIDSFISFGHLQTAGIKDLAAHKASALCSRDEIKDYIDIAFLTKQQNWLLQDLEEFAEQKFALGTISEEKMLTELIVKRDSFSIPPEIFLNHPDQNIKVVKAQINYLIEHTSL